MGGGGPSVQHASSDPHPQPGEHIDQAINAEEVETPSDEIADPGLRHPKQFSRLSQEHSHAHDSDVKMTQKGGTIRAIRQSDEVKRGLRIDPKPRKGKVRCRSSVASSGSSSPCTMTIISLNTSTQSTLSTGEGGN
jgi:hypothetical protein